VRGSFGGRVIEVVCTKLPKNERLQSRIEGLVQVAGITQPAYLVAAIAATTKSGVVPPHSKAASCRSGCQLVAYLMRGVLRIEGLK
jgi:hypothetical protein